MTQFDFKMWLMLIHPQRKNSNVLAEGRTGEGLDGNSFLLEMPLPPWHMLLLIER